MKCFESIDRDVSHNIVSLFPIKEETLTDILGLRILDEKKNWDLLTDFEFLFQSKHFEGWNPEVFYLLYNPNVNEWNLNEQGVNRQNKNLHIFKTELDILKYMNFSIETNITQYLNNRPGIKLISIFKLLKIESLKLDTVLKAKENNISIKYRTIAKNEEPFSIFMIKSLLCQKGNLVSGNITDANIAENVIELNLIHSPKYNNG
jgi:hypothetical protein